jgi:hypothetical protein
LFLKGIELPDNPFPLVSLDQAVQLIITDIREPAQYQERSFRVPRASPTSHLDKRIQRAVSQSFQNLCVAGFG